MVERTFQWFYHLIIVTHICHLFGLWNMYRIISFPYSIDVVFKWYVFASKCQDNKFLSALVILPLNILQFACYNDYSNPKNYAHSFVVVYHWGILAISGIVRWLLCRWSNPEKYEWVLLVNPSSDNTNVKKRVYIYEIYVTCMVKYVIVWYIN